MSLVDEILTSRGYVSKVAREAFLSPSYEAEKHDPFLLPDMEKAVERIVLAQRRGERVVIYGDYDIDGLTAATVLCESFEKFGLNASVFIPNRFVEGYGLSGPALETLADNGAQLVVTVDCGSLSHKEIDHANSLGMDVIVTDHHSVAETMPAAVAVINPKRLLVDYPDRYEGFELRAPETIAASLAATASSRGKSSAKSLQAAELGHGLKQSSPGQDPVENLPGLSRAASKAAIVSDGLYPFVDLAGVGVAFKLVQALQTRLEGLPLGQEKWLLDLVAFGTVCDVVQLRGENRANVFWGLQVMQKTRRVGLKMLMAVAKIEPKSINARTLGFVFGPRLNASGRMETAQIALDLLMTTDRKQAFELAERLELMNAERRAEQDRIVTAANEQATQFEADKVLVVSDPTWSHGIIGIVAAKLLERHHKPAFVLQELADGTAKGSARSFGDFSAVAAIRATDQLLIKGGGHKLAAGITLETSNIVQWREAVNVYYRGLGLKDQEKHLRAQADVDLTSFDGVDEGVLEKLSALEPYGNGNPVPVFCLRAAVVASRRTMGDSGQHVSYVFHDKKGQTLSMKAWNSSDEFTAESGEEVDVWFELELNEWRGRRSVEGRMRRLEVVLERDI